MLISILSFIAILSVLILIHEAGHFFVAKKLGIWVEEFGLGLPPRAFGKKIGKTIYSLNWLPLGGFVRLHGENTEDTVTNPSVAFLNKSKRTRTAVIVAGVVMNLLLGIVIFSILYSIYGVTREKGYVEVVYVGSGSPAESVGIENGDIVKELDGIQVRKSEEFITLIQERKGKEVSLVVKRGSEENIFKVKLREDPKEGEGALGVGLSSTEIYHAPIWQRPFYGAYYGLGTAFNWGKNILVGMGNIFTELFSGKIPKDLAGPIGILDITDQQVVPLGLLGIVEFMAILSVNLAIINILPIPALDGGRLLFIVIEAVTKKRVNQRVEATIHSIGMVCLLVLLLGISILDVRRLVENDRLPDFLQRFFN